MSLRLGIKDMKTLYVYIIAICMTNFFGFYKFLPMGRTFYSVDYMHICIFVSSLVFFFYSLLKRRGKISKGKYWHLSLAMIFLIAAEVIWTYSRYRQPISLACKEGFYYIVPIFAYFTFYQLYSNQMSAYKICDIFIKVGIISSIVAVAAYVLYTYGGINFLQLADSMPNNFRNGTIRFSVGSTVVFMATIMSITRVLWKEYTKIDVINLALSAIQIIVINKTRTSLLYMVMLILLIFLFGKKVNPFLKVLMIILVIMCGAGVFISLDNVTTNILDYFNADAGIRVRFSAIEFYMSQFKQVPVLGMGLISSSKDIAGWQLLYGPAGYFYRDDVGIVGLLNKFGIAGLIWAVCFLRSASNNVKKIMSVHAVIVRNIVMFCVITMINLSFMDYQRLMYIFVIMVLSDLCMRDERKRMAET